MIIIKLTGGLGNQFFQYAYGRSLSLRQNKNLILDTSWYKGRLNRHYMLDLYNIEAREASWLTRFFKKKEILEDTGGNWHSEKFLSEYADHIKKELTLKNPLSAQSEDFLRHIQSVNSVSIHVRGGDYIRGSKSAYHSICPPEYYAAAIKLIQEKIPAPHFFIFTDDLSWTQEHIEFPTPHTVVSETENPPEEELALMSACKYNIIANSTFSWWAAWLNRNPEKIVVAPSKWFTDEKINSSDILPASWIRI